MLNLRQMQVFHAVMQTGSVTAAARSLNVTQPAVSAVLKHCESQLKMKLFVHVGGRLQPTQEAEAIFPDVSDIFERVEAVGRLTEDLRGGRLGTLNIAASVPMANGMLTEAVTSFVARRPELNVTLLSLSSPQVLNRVVNRAVDLGVANEPIISPAVETESLLSVMIACVLRSDHPLAERDIIHASDLEPYPIITFLPQNIFRSYIDRALSQAGVAPKISVQVNNSLTGIMLARSGAGIALVESHLVRSMELSNVVVRPLRPRIELNTLLIRNRFAPVSRITDSFIAHLREVAALPGNCFPADPDDPL